MGKGDIFYVLSTDQMKDSEDGGRRDGGGGLGLGKGRGNVSSPTIPTPNQLSFISFPQPINVIHSK